MRGTLLALVAAPALVACIPVFTTQAPESPQASDQERRRQEALEWERTQYQQRLDEARRAFEAARDVDTFARYCDVVIASGALSPGARAGVDVAPDEEALLRGAGKELLDRLQADHAKKKQRTLALREGLKAVHAQRVKLIRWRRPEGDEAREDGLAALALGYPDDEWAIGDGVWVTDLSFLEDLEKERGRKAVHELCRAALDRVVADDRRDRTRQHYVLEACVLDYGDWEADLAAWASPRETKEFRRIYAPIYAEAAADVDAIEAERAAKGRANARGSAGSDKPLVSLINSCERKIRLVIGDDPGSAGARTLSLLADEVVQERIKADQRVWLVDDKKKAITHATVSRYTNELEFSCTGVSYR